MVNAETEVLFRVYELADSCFQTVDYLPDSAIFDWPPTNFGNIRRVQIGLGGDSSWRICDQIQECWEEGRTPLVRFNNNCEHLAKIVALDICGGEANKLNLYIVIDRNLIGK